MMAVAESARIAARSERARPWSGCRPKKWPHMVRIKMRGVWGSIVSMHNGLARSCQEASPSGSTFVEYGPGDSFGSSESAWIFARTMGVRSLRVLVEGGSCLDLCPDGKGSLPFASLTMAHGLSIWRRGNGDFDICGIAVTPTRECVPCCQLRICRRSRLGRSWLRASVKPMRRNGFFRRVGQGALICEASRC